MDSGILLCSDLDRTLLPNGPQPESPAARPLLRALAARPEMSLAYVSGRHRDLLREAIEEFELPMPDFAIGDVGTTMYEVRGADWHPWERWYDDIAPDWHGHSREDLQRLFADLQALRPQEAGKQNTFKLSYYASAARQPDELLAEMRRRLDARGVRAALIWSVDEVADLGLLDVLPRRATKLHAVEFLMAERGFDPARTVFAGDSGNDLPVLTSGLQAVLVRNARDEVRDAALRQVEAHGRRDRLYLAAGGLLGMNGNYAAGVLEGLVHFLPHTRAWLQPANDPAPR